MEQCTSIPVSGTYFCRIGFLKLMPASKSFLIEKAPKRIRDGKTVWPDNHSVPVLQNTGLIEFEVTWINPFI